MTGKDPGQPVLTEDSPPAALISSARNATPLRPLVAHGRASSLDTDYELTDLHVRLLTSRSDGDDLAAVVVQDEHLRRPHRPARPALRLLTAVLARRSSRSGPSSPNLLAVGVHVELHQALPSIRDHRLGVG